MFNRLKTYLPVATFLVLVVSLCYLEFPVVTGLILLIMVVLYLCFNDGIGGKKKAFWPLPLVEKSKPDGAQPPYRLVVGSSGGHSKFEKNRCRTFLGGLSGFCLNLKGQTIWRHPFIIGQAEKIARSTLEREGLLCGKQDLWLADSQFACLQLEVIVERLAGFVGLTVNMSLLGVVEVNRKQGNIRDQTVFWQYTVQRATAGSLIQASLQDALAVGFDALLRDYLSETYNTASSDKPTATKLLPWKTWF
jgi:hypothetical protein